MVDGLGARSCRPKLVSRQNTARQRTAGDGAPRSVGTHARPRAPLSVAIARAYRSMETRLHTASRLRCSAANALANSTCSPGLSRQRRILEALVDARAALSEALRVDFGDRFNLKLSVSDLEGWPKLELLLIDNCQEFMPGITGVVADSISAGAIERSSRGLVFFALNHDEILAHIAVDNDIEFDTLPEVLVESVSQFLTRASDVTLQPAPEQQQTGPRVLPEQDAAISRAESSDLNDDLLALDFLSEQ